MNLVQEKAFVVSVLNTIAVQVSFLLVILIQKMKEHIIDQSAFLLKLNQDKIFSQCKLKPSSRVSLFRLPLLYYSFFNCSIGDVFYIWFKIDDKDIVLIYLSNNPYYFNSYVIKLKKNSFKLRKNKSAFIESKIIDFLCGKIKVLPIKFCFLLGSNFEKRVWEFALKISYGNTASYKYLAEISGYPKAYRSVGSAIGRNPLMIIVPCHRIIKASGEIGNFGGGVYIKEYLLSIEKTFKSN